MKSSKYFFSRKNLFLATGVVVSLYIALWAVTIISSNVSKNRAKHAADVRHKQYDSQSPEQKSILKAEAYLKTSLETVKVEQRLILDFLQRKFGLDESLSASSNPFHITENPRVYPQEINFIARISYPDKIVTVPPRSIVDGPVLTNIYSANCDHLPLPANFWPTMHQNYTAGGYYLTHIALAFAFMRDNGCSIPVSEENLLNETVESMIKLADDAGTEADLRYEAIAFLLLSGKYSLIEPAWIDSIISEQQPGGGWAENIGDKKISDHATVLALWALLEYDRPSTPYEPLIPRPTNKN